MSRNKIRTSLCLFAMTIITTACNRNLDCITSTTKLINPYVNCKISKETYKTFNKFSAIGRENIYIDNRPYSVGVEYIKKYLYDVHGRITQEKEVGYNNYDSVITDYLYSNKQIVFRKSFYKNITVSVISDTVMLNDKGLIHRYSELEYFFDNDDYLIQIINNKATYYKTSKTLSDNNFIKESRTFGEGTENKLNEYDLSKSNISSNKPFYGKQNYNLLSKTTINVSNSVSIINGNKYALTYSYTFDNKNRVSRQIRLGKAIDKGWSFIYDTGEIGVTDFEYDCN